MSINIDERFPDLVNNVLLTRCLKLLVQIIMSVSFLEKKLIHILLM